MVEEKKEKARKTPKKPLVSKEPKVSIVQADKGWMERFRKM